MENLSQEIREYKINTILMSQYRIEIMKTLLEGHPLRFNLLRDALGLTDGNMASHLRALEKAGYIKYEKQFIGRMTATFYQITTDGSRAYNAFRKDMLDLLE